ncbi:MAG: alpha/beta hydrolase domain-containing protein [Janthinobacterium lividum]
MPRFVPAALAISLLTTPALAEVSRFEVLGTVQPALGGRVFGPPSGGGMPTGFGGTATRIDARVTIALDPADPHNAGIVDIAAAPRNAAGRVEATTDVVILRPERPNGTMVLDVPNRGRKLINTLLEDATPEQTARLEQAGDAGRGFLLSQGFTVVWVGWQGDLQQGMRITVPVVPGLTGPNRDEWVVGEGSGSMRQVLSYPMATAEGARLTVRARPEDERQTPADLSFRMADPTTIDIIRPGQSFGARAIYELTYTARDPALHAMGFAALRDVASFLRHDAGPGNPLADAGLSHTIGFGISQSGRVLRDFLYQGFNQDERNRIVFDGLLAEIPGARRTFTNARFAQPGRNPGPNEDRGYPVDQFPFTYDVTEDAQTGKRDGLLVRCRETGSCPRIMQVDSEFEQWGSHGSLLVTDPQGAPVKLPSEVRGYMVAGTPHFAAFDDTAKPVPGCQLPGNPVSSAPVVRALLVAMERWVRADEAPPESRYPGLDDRTLVAAPAPDLYPVIPGLPYHGMYVPAERWDNSGPVPKSVGTYKLFLPAVDADGNAQGGVRLPVLAAPRATYTGWNLRRDGTELCTQIGSTLPFAATRAAREAALDPRPSIEERYPAPDSYVSAVDAAAAALVQQRLLLPVEQAEMVAAARAGTLARLPR